MSIDDCIKRLKIRISIRPEYREWRETLPFSSDIEKVKKILDNDFKCYSYEIIQHEAKNTSIANVPIYVKAHYEIIIRK